MTDDEISNIKEEVKDELTNIIDEVKKYCPWITKEKGGILGGIAGAPLSLTILCSSGKIAGLSAAGITSGLKAIGGSMLAGLGVLALPVGGGVILGYVGVKKYIKNKKTATITQAISRLLDIKSRLIQNTEHFQDEITDIENTIEALKKR